MLYKPQNEELTYTELLEICEQTVLSITRDEVILIENSTQGQSKSAVWFTQRAGRITASKMKSACTTDPGNPAQSLIQQVCYPHLHKFKNTAVEWGCSHEGAVINAYTEFMKKGHSDFKCSKNGLFISEECPFIGASPDGMTDCLCCGAGVLEVKCPYCIRMEDPGTATCLEAGKLSTQHAYYYQIQLQMFVCSVDHADFVIGTFQESKPSLRIERITFNREFVTTCVEKAHKFFDLCILPELVGKWYSRKAVLPDQAQATSTSDGQYIYCYCKIDKGGEMVACDNSSCAHGTWFHLECLKLSNAPRSAKWYCPNCRLLPEFSRKRKKTK